MDKLVLRLPDGYAQDTPVLVAYSGGADSSLLLHLLHRAGVHVYAVHVHHGIRGKDADADLQFCRETCRAMGIPFFAVKVNVPALAKKHGQSLEQAAREARYRHFARLMQAHNIPLLATAHHADDNLETLLFRLCRGTGTHGLRGIPALAPLPGAQDGSLCLFRPLLHLTKQEILQECKSLGISYVTDATNACDDYARNRIRNRVVPELEHLFHQPQKIALRLCRAAAEDCDALDAMADALYVQHAEQGAIPLPLLQSQPAAIAKRLIARLYAEHAREHMAEAVHIDAIYARVKENVPGSISLPGKYAAVIDRDALRMQPDTATASLAYRLPLQGGFCTIGDAKVTVWSSFPENQKTDTAFDANVYNLYTELQVRFDTIKGRVFLRPMAEGDRILQGGMHKKIRKLYGQHGTPLHLRSRLPLLCDDNGILAVPGICLRDGSAPRPGEKTLCVRIYLPKTI